MVLHHAEVSPDRVGQEERKEAEAAFAAYLDALNDAGVLVSAGIPQPGVSATTLTDTYGEREEERGGVFILDVPDQDAALARAGKCPAVHWGAIEIRPTAVYSNDGSWVRSTGSGARRPEIKRAAARNSRCTDRRHRARRGRRLRRL